MNSTKFLIGGIIAGIAYFLLGWLVWGILLMDFMNHHTNQASGIFRDQNSMVWWAMIVGNLAMGFLLSFIITKSKVTSVMGGATAGFVFGLLSTVSFDCIMYAQTYLIDRRGMVVDVIAATVVSAIVGAVVGWYNGRGASAA